jgi:ATP-binding cassette subfamily C (CFTR/MRP) protein 1
LSGGQKARVALARAVFFDADICVMVGYPFIMLLRYCANFSQDDVLAAVDAHVSAHLLEKCILHPDGLGSKTRILVTHHLEVAPHADKIVVVENGQIVQQGSYEDLKSTPGIFATMLQDYGQEETEELEEEKEADAKELHKIASKKAGGPGFKLLMDEERNTGSVEWATYGAFFKAMGSYLYPLLSVVFLCLAQGANVGNTLVLGFWSGRSIHGFQQGVSISKHEMSVARLDADITFTGLHGHLRRSWLRLGYLHVHRVSNEHLELPVFANTFRSYNLSISGLRASLTLFKKALNGVMRSPILFHDSTPIGRIISRLSKGWSR